MSEDDNDDVFYKACLEKIHRCEYEVIATKVRTGGGIVEVRKALPRFLSMIRNTGPVESTYFLISVDNDRRPQHPDHPQRCDFNQLSKDERNDSCRYCEIEGKIQDKLGKERSIWPIPGAIVIPAEMLESWLLLICDSEKYGTEAKLPVFSDKNKASAIKYYGGKNKVPDQLKDLVDSERQTLGQSKQEFYRHCASILDPDALAQVSLSFAQFLSQVISWN